VSYTLEQEKHVMNRSIVTRCAVLVIVLLAAACTRQESTPLDKAVNSAKDALDMRDHEKLKDAGEEARDAVKDAATGVKDAAREAADQVKEAANPSSTGN
jgi:hypothetical protein